MKPVQLDIPFGELHPLARRLLGARRSWPRGRPEGLTETRRVIHTCDWFQLVSAYADVMARKPPLPDPFPEVSW